MAEEPGPPRCQHVALSARDLEAVLRFHRGTLGLEVANYLPDEGVLALRLRDGFMLRYERSDRSVDAEAVGFIGLEVSSFASLSVA
jgi:catechol 2,3-dioxygenase-like lactoylglutathione lyase family enzyme